MHQRGVLAKGSAFLRSSLFWMVFAGSTVLYGGTLWLLALAPYERRFPVILTWSRLNIWVLEKVCGVRYRVEGRENLPRDRAAIAVANHQSTWETLVFSFLLPPQVWVLKKQLLRIPFFGWGLAMAKPIAIDRSAGKSARQQVIDMGRERLREGLWVVIFPEGTRVRPGEIKRFKPGAAILAEATGYPIVPIAHNAGLLWPRHQFIKYPGEITVRIGPMIDPAGLNRDEINAKLESWIRRQMDELNDGAVTPRPASR